MPADCFRAATGRRKEPQTGAARRREGGRGDGRKGRGRKLTERQAGKETWQPQKGDPSRCPGLSPPVSEVAPEVVVPEVRGGEDPAGGPEVAEGNSRRETPGGKLQEGNSETETAERAAAANGRIEKTSCLDEEDLLPASG